MRLTTRPRRLVVSQIVCHPQIVCQIVCHVAGYSASQSANAVDGDAVPVPHFGLVLSLQQVHNRKQRELLPSVDTLDKQIS